MFIAPIRIGEASNGSGAYPPPVYLYDAERNEIDRWATIGNEITIQRNIVNPPENKNQEFICIIEVRNDENITLLLEWQSGNIQSNDVLSIRVNWLPEKVGEYEIRTMVISDFVNASNVNAQSIELVTIIPT